jgi:hypothetical protein
MEFCGDNYCPNTCHCDIIIIKPWLTLVNQKIEKILPAEMPKAGKGGG